MKHPKKVQAIDTTNMNWRGTLKVHMQGECRAHSAPAVQTFVYRQLLEP